MTENQWTKVDRYIDDLFGTSDPALDAALKACVEAGLPPINVSPSQGKFLFILAKAIGARHVLEMGTLGGYSTIWLARALPPDGRLVTIEVDPKHAAVASENFARAELAHLIDLRPGSALDVLPQLVGARESPFDMIFIDADKENYPDYLEWSITLAHAGTLIIADNVVREGAVVDSHSEDPRVQAVRRFNTALAADSRVSATEIQTVGSKGYDGFAAIVVTKSPSANVEQRRSR
jgi:predicted O-methyltransferase YrrM